MRSFEVVPQPDPLTYAGVPFEPWPSDEVDVVATPPGRDLFVGEAEYWSEKLMLAHTTRNVQLVRQSELMRKMFTGLSRQRPEKIVYDLDEFTAATALVGLSRYLRTEHDPHLLDTNDPGSEIPKIMMTFNSTEAERAGVHIPLESLAYREMTVPQNGEPLYFEGEELFIQVTSPAAFSAYEQSVAASHGVVLDQNQYASIIPRPKRYIWAGY